jgi:hypothetical protein
MDLREMRMVRFRCCGPRLVKSNAVKVQCRSQPQVVYVHPVRVFRLQLGARGHFHRPQCVTAFGYRTEICAFLWSGEAPLCSVDARILPIGSLPV